MLGKDVSAPHSEHTEIAVKIGSSSSRLSIQILWKWGLRYAL